MNMQPGKDYVEGESSVIGKDVKHIDVRDIDGSVDPGDLYWEEVDVYRSNRAGNAMGFAVTENLILGINVAQ